jgi:hypothetical protein
MTMLLTPALAAERIGITVSAVNRAIARGALRLAPGIPQGPRSRLLRPADVDLYAANTGARKRGRKPGAKPKAKPKAKAKK